MIRSILLAGLLFISALQAQDTLLYNDGGTLYMEAGATLYVEGSVVNPVGAQFTNNGGEVALSGDWSNYGTYFSGSGTLRGKTRFFGTDTSELYGNSTSLRFGRLEIDKAYQVPIEKRNTLYIEDSLIFKGGLLGGTALVYTVVLNPSPGIITGYSLPGSAVDDRYVERGFLRRAINRNQVYEFPVGAPPADGGYQFVRVDVQDRDGATQLDALFVAGQSTSAPNTTECGALYDCMLSTAGGHGRYSVNIASSNALLDISVAPRNFAFGCGGGTYTLVSGGTFNGTACSGYVGSLDPINGTLITRTAMGSSPFLYVTGSGNTFPVEWLEFSAIPQGTDALLRWSTGSETQNAYFEVQRADVDGNFFPIGQVEGQGTTQETSRYQFLDPQPGAGTHLYRLRQVDLDGQSELSEVRSIRFDEVSFTLGPNPFDRHLQITYPNQGRGLYQLSLFNSLGQPAAQQNLSGTGQDELYLPQLPEGVYSYVLSVPKSPVRKGKLVCVH